MFVLGELFWHKLQESAVEAEGEADNLLVGFMNRMGLVREASELNHHIDAVDKNSKWRGCCSKVATTLECLESDEANAVC